MKLDMLGVSGLSAMFFSVRTSSISGDWKSEPGVAFSALLRRMFVILFTRIRGSLIKLTKESRNGYNYEKAAPWLASFKNGGSIRSTVHSCCDILEQHPRTDGIEKELKEAYSKNGLGCLAELGVNGFSGSFVNTHFFAIRVDQNITTRNHYTVPFQYKNDNSNLIIIPIPTFLSPYLPT